MVTVQEVLLLPVLRGAQVVAGRRGLQAPVRWCHVAEVLDIARLLSGGELLLTTGLALDVAPARQAAYIADLHASGVAGLMLELNRPFHTVPQALVDAAEGAGLPLISLPFDTKFVQVTEAVHRLVLGRQPGSRDAEPASAGEDEQLLADLWAERTGDVGTLRRRLAETGRRLPDPAWAAVLVVDSKAPPATVRAAAAELGARTWVYGVLGGEGHLLAFAADPTPLAGRLRTLALGLPWPTGVSRGFADPAAAPRALAEAQQTMRLRRIRPTLDPLSAEIGVYRLAFGGGNLDLQGFVTEWLGPLIQYDRIHKSDLCETLRLLLDDQLVMNVVAGRLHITRQGLYYREQRIAEVLGRDLGHVEVRLSLSVALRFWDVLASEQG